MDQIRSLLADLFSDHPALETCAGIASNPRILPLYPLGYLMLDAVGQTLLSSRREDQMIGSAWERFSGNVAAFLDNPWFLGFYLIAAFYAIFWSAKSVAKEKERIAESQIAAQKALLDDFRKEFSVLAEIPHFVRLSWEVDKLRKVNEVGGAISAAQELISNLKNPDAKKREAFGVQSELSNVLHRVETHTYDLEGLALPDPPQMHGDFCFDLENCEKQTMAMGGVHYTFAPERHQAYWCRVEEYLNGMRAWQEQVERELEAKKSEHLLALRHLHDAR